MDRLDQFSGNVAEQVVTHDPDGAVVSLQGVVEGEFLVRETQFITAVARLAHFFRKPDQLLDDLRRLYSAVLIASKRVLQHFRE